MQISRICSIVILISFLGTINLAGCASSRKGVEPNEPVDKYRLDVAYTIQKNWIVPANLPNNANLKCAFIFKILPDGKIVDIQFYKSSGSEALDNSALATIERASPVDPYPAGIELPFVEMGLYFTPRGVK